MRLRTESNCQLCVFCLVLQLFVSYYGYYLRWLIVESVCKVFIEGDEMGDVDITVVLFGKNILPDLVSAPSSAHVRGVPVSARRTGK